MELKLTKENFEKEVLNSELPVMVDFWADWCGPCRMLAPVLEKLAEHYAGKAVIGKVNVDEEQELAFKYRVSSIPTIYVFKGGQIVNRLVGARSFEDLSTALEQTF